VQQRAWRWLAALAVVVGLEGRAPAGEFFFKPRDRIVFLGDSITEQSHYTNYIEYYLVTRFPDWDLVFFNAGISGDTAGGGNTRAARDVLSERPTAVTINFGMNDGGYRALDERIYGNYIRNQDALVKKLAEAKVRVALLSTSPVEERKRRDGETYNRTLLAFCEGLKSVAAKHGATHGDQFRPALLVLRRMAKDKASFECFPDSVHTNHCGGLLMAHSILTALGAPAVVSDLTLDASGKVASAERCKVSDVKAAGGGLSFTRTDEALPLVPSPDHRDLLDYLDSLSALNHYGLKVTGLAKDERYELKIDGNRAALLKGEALEKGVNLALTELGPIAAQSVAVWNALTEKNRLVRWRFNTYRRSVTEPPGLSKQEQEEINALRERELAVIERALDSQRKKIYDLTRPGSHRFELTRKR
jgi:lysophospholipase L1-like esterase